MKKQYVILTIIFACVFFVSNVIAEEKLPESEFKYLIFNTEELPSSPGKFNEIMSSFGDTSDFNTKIGLSHIFSYFRKDVQEVKKDLQAFLYSAEKKNTPVVIKLDGEQWWDNRPDLWNWWDENKPGYDPTNVKNVEWTGWESDRAMKIAWRNWGRQLRVLPPPNLMSTVYRRETHKAMDVMLAVVMNWWKKLPENKKYLFVALNVGWESSLCYNAYYYPNGNDYLDKPEKDDPTSGTVRGDVLNRGLIQSGYNAVRTAGIRIKGDITEDDLLEIVRRHLEDLAKYANEFGFPRKKIFTHGVGNEFGEKLYDAAVNEYSCPGWSGYWYAEDPAKDKGIMRNLERSDAPHWAVVEYLLLKPYEKGQAWEDAFFTTLNYPNCKFICVYNWEGVNSKGSKVIDAANRAVKRLSGKKKD